MKKGMITALVIMMIACLCSSAVYAADAPARVSDRMDSLTSDTDSSGTAGNGYSPKKLYESAAPKVVTIITYDRNDNAFSLGTGFFINGSGVLVTNNHVIADSWSADIQTFDGRSFPVTQVIGYDPVIDLAILRADITGNEYLNFAQTPVETGDPIYTLGSALGLSGTFSDGLVSTASRIMDDVDYIQISAPISQGNSGGPLLNAFGEVVGVNTLGTSEGQNINFAVNINELRRLNIDNPLTMSEYYDKTVGTDTPASPASAAPAVSSDPDIQAWFDEADLKEIESNDSFSTADSLRVRYWAAGCVDGQEDYDCFSVHVSDETNLFAMLFPMYTDDNNYLIMALTDADANVLAYSSPETANDGSVYQYLSCPVEAPGTYYIVLCVSEEYSYSDPSYYQLAAEW